MYCTGGVDYEATVSELAFDMNTNRACAQIPIIDDDISEALETFSVSINVSDAVSTPQGIIIMPDTASITVLDNDGMLLHLITVITHLSLSSISLLYELVVQVMFARPSYTFNEDDVIGIIEVVISGSVLQDTEVFVIGGTNM